MTLSIACLALGGLSLTPGDTSTVREGFLTEEACPPCELLFRNLERTRSDGKLTQVVKVQERGEPKSGTGMVFDWATGALIRTCDYLKHFFGKKTSVMTGWDVARETLRKNLDKSKSMVTISDGPNRLGCRGWATCSSCTV